VDWAIRAENVTKRYRLGERMGLSALTGRNAEHLVAVNDVSFSVDRGECFGVVGGNGSGKSTLLSLIAAITLPTSGHIDVHGRVLPLLTIGAGFAAELTGRENVELNGAILGLSRDAVQERMDDIAAFAELERHMDTPLKRYSTGMQSRLSFSLAVLFPADIYLFDEVLAVVDAEFRIRCLSEIRSLTAQGRTVLFVSHDAYQVRTICDRVLWMKQGLARMLGPAAEVLDEYVDHP
jgi:ABC-type polysaccharide/polyol phosphate transport system ATPase subunit